MNNSVYENLLSTGEFEGDDSTQGEALRSRLISQDYNLCKALYEDASITKIEKVRSAIVLGDLETARDLINRLRTGPEREALEDLDLEDARISIYQGDFESALEFTSSVIKGQPDITTRMAAFQVRSLAHYELSNFSDALSDAESVKALGRRFSKGYLAFGAECITAKCLMFMGRFDEADQILSSLWISFLTENRIDLNSLHSLVRVEIERRRHRQINFSSWAELSRSISLTIGDRPYHRLALLDLAFDSSRPNIQLTKMLAEEAKTDLRLKRYLGLEGRECSTTKLLRKVAIEKASTIEIAALERKMNLSTQQIWIEPTCHLVISLSGKWIKSLSESEKLFDTLEILTDAPIKAESFAKKAWGIEKYSREKHEPPIRRLLQRLKLELNLQTHLEKNSIQTIVPIIKLEGL